MSSWLKKVVLVQCKTSKPRQTTLCNSWAPSTHFPDHGTVHGSLIWMGIQALNLLSSIWCRWVTILPLQVQSFGLILRFEERKLTKTCTRTPPPSKKLNIGHQFHKHLAFLSSTVFRHLQPDYHSDLESFWILGRLKNRLKDIEMVLAYSDNIDHIYFLHLAKFLSSDCLF